MMKKSYVKAIFNYVKAMFNYVKVIRISMFLSKLIMNFTQKKIYYNLLGVFADLAKNFPIPYLPQK